MTDLKLSKSTLLKDPDNTAEDLDDMPIGLSDFHAALCSPYVILSHLYILE